MIKLLVYSLYLTDLMTSTVTWTPVPCLAR